MCYGLGILLLIYCVSTVVDAPQETTNVGSVRQWQSYESWIVWICHEWLTANVLQVDNGYSETSMSQVSAHDIPGVCLIDRKSETMGSCHTDVSPLKHIAGFLRWSMTCSMMEIWLHVWKTAKVAQSNEIRAFPTKKRCWYVWPFVAHNDEVGSAQTSISTGHSCSTSLVMVPFKACVLLQVAVRPGNATLAARPGQVSEAKNDCISSQHILTLKHIRSRQRHVRDQHIISHGSMAHWRAEKVNQVQITAQDWIS